MEETKGIELVDERNNEMDRCVFDYFQVTFCKLKGSS